MITPDELHVMLASKPGEKDEDISIPDSIDPLSLLACSQRGPHEHLVEDELTGRVERQTFKWRCYL